MLLQPARAPLRAESRPSRVEPSRESVRSSPRSSVASEPGRRVTSDCVQCFVWIRCVSAARRAAAAHRSDTQKVSEVLDAPRAQSAANSHCYTSQIVQVMDMENLFRMRRSSLCSVSRRILLQHSLCNFATCCFLRVGSLARLRKCGKRHGTKC